jgi:arabinofuranosyltransferase
MRRTSKPPSDPFRWARFASLPLGLLGPIALFLCLLPHQAHPIDDAYISYRFAWNFSQGHGLVFNIGERVEGFSNPLWTVLSAVPIVLGAAPFGWMRALSIVAAVGLLMTLFVAGKREGGGRPVLVVSTWLLATSMPMLCATESGMETVFFAAILFGGALAHEVAGERDRFPWLAGALYALASLTRPEAIAFIGLLVLLSPGQGRRFVRWFPLLAAGVAFGLLECGRLAYYHALLPNTFHAKVGEPAIEIRDGLRYVSQYFLAHPFGPALALSAMLIVPRQVLRRRRHFLALIAFVLLYVIYVGGDWMPHFRFLVVLEPFLFVWADEWFHAAHFASSRHFLAFAALLIVMGAEQRVRELKAGLWNMADTDHGWDQSAGRVARWFRDRRATGVVALADIGVVGWENRDRMRVLDLYGLTDPVIASIPGRHMKKLGPKYRDRVLGAKPDYIVLSGDHDCDEPSDLEWAEIYFDPRFKPQYQLVLHTNEGARFGWCVYQRK